jgi:16S rRNA (cytidine1402-2'-O)-methyltransferase
LSVVLGTLWLVATPIGNLEDITVRGLRVLRAVPVIAAEDTRHSLKLLAHFDISVRLVSYHDHNKERMTEPLLALLERGDVALITDAGTPCLSDPGYEIVGAALAAGYPVELVPGADAVTTTLAAGLLPAPEGMRRFRFIGFPPRKESALAAVLRPLAQAAEVLVLYESPNRLVKTLDVLHALYGDRRAVVGVEMTKFYEEIARGTLSALIAHFSRLPIRGEVTLLVAPAHPT